MADVLRVASDYCCGRITFILVYSEGMLCS